MRITRLFVNQPLIIHETITLNQEQTNHLARVLRLNLQDHVILFNGEGDQFLALISNIDKKKSQLTVIQKQTKNTESPLDLTLLLGLSRSDRMDYAIQKSVELGVKRIIPIITQHTTIKLNTKKIDHKYLHWQSIIVHACEQSDRIFIPELSTILSLDDFINEKDDSIKILFHPHRQSIKSFPENIKKMTILIGPEGGFSETEIEKTMAAGFYCKQLGPRILRTETAPVAAITWAQYQWGDMS